MEEPLGSRLTFVASVAEITMERFPAGTHTPTLNLTAHLQGTYGLGSKSPAGISFLEIEILFSLSFTCRNALISAFLTQFRLATFPSL